MRIDRLLCELNIGTRSQVKELLKKGVVLVNGEKLTRPDIQVEEEKAEIICQGKSYHYHPFVYYMMNKPAGVITATKDQSDTTVMDIFKEQYIKITGGTEGIPVRDIFPVGRLDKDTVGLLVLTNDGKMAHELLSPGKHVPKTYYVETDSTITKEQISCLEQGVVIGEGEITREAKVSYLEEKACTITITEGKYHQVKRMFQSVGLQVKYLKRISMGGLELDQQLKEGCIRELTEKEVAMLCLRT